MNNNILFAGVDEAGYGPLAGPVIAAAVILPRRMHFPNLRDSKQLTALQRNKLFDLIYAKATAVSVGRAEVEEIDTLNIFHATMLAMQRAILGLSIVPELVMIDGRAVPKLNIPSQAIVDGDEKIRAISAASIIAKVTRDREMDMLDKTYPVYKFAKHKGYSTKEHKLLIKEHGMCDIHRRSFCIPDDTNTTAQL